VLVPLRSNFGADHINCGEAFVFSDAFQDLILPKEDIETHLQIG